MTDPEMSLAAARDRVMTQALAGGTVCPCCDQYVKVYRRKLNAGQARSLIGMYRLGAAERYVHLPTELSARSREEGKLAHWGLVQELAEPRPDGGRAGWWQLTPKGVDFVFGLIRVPSHVFLYDDRLLAFDGEEITIREALGNKFDYDELMYS